VIVIGTVERILRLDISFKPIGRLHGDGFLLMSTRIRDKALS
jgi:hypothetical protein